MRGESIQPTKPTNQNKSGKQEPGTNQEIKAFVAKYNVTFQLFDKIDVNGENAHPLYKYLKEKKKDFLGTSGIKWNFAKVSDLGPFLISPFEKKQQQQQQQQRTIKTQLPEFILSDPHQFLVSKEGKPVNRYLPITDPFSIEPDIMKELEAGQPRAK